MDNRRDPKKERGNQETTSHPALKLRHILRGHDNVVYRMALSPDASTLASPSQDKTLRLWDVKSGKAAVTTKHGSTAFCCSWSPSGKWIATGGGAGDTGVRIWRPNLRNARILGAHSKIVSDVAWSPDESLLASASLDGTLLLWDLKSKQLRNKFEVASPVSAIAWSPDGRRLLSASPDAVRLWDVSTGHEIRRLPQSSASVAWSADPIRPNIAVGSSDHIIGIWDPQTGLQRYRLEGQTGSVVSVSFVHRGRLLASLSREGTVVVWRTDTWTEVMRIDRIGEVNYFSTLVAHPIVPMIVTPGMKLNEISIWYVDVEMLLREQPAAATTVFYVNAKAVLLGDSGVGKSGLGIRLAESRFRPTEGSTHGAQFWHFPRERLPQLPPNVRAELTLWDLAGQPEYRLTHQLFLDDTDAALLLFDCSDPSDPFRGVPYWAKVLRKHAPSHATKLLISARCDVSLSPWIAVESTSVSRNTTSMSISRRAHEQGRALPHYSIVYSAASPGKGYRGQALPDSFRLCANSC